MRIETETSHSTPGFDPGYDAEYRLIDVARIVRLVWRRRITIVLFAVGGCLVGSLAAYFIAPRYEATVRLMPPARKDISLLSVSSSRNDGDLYLGLANSRSVTDDVIEHQHLADYLHMQRPSELRRGLASMTKISVDKDQFVSVTVRALEPETAVRIANEYPEALTRLNRTIALSQAAHRWEHFEGPLEQEKNKLAEAEDQLKQAQQKTGIVLPDTQVQLGLGAIATLKQEITAREGQLAAIRTGSTEQNPEVVQLRSQIGSLSGQLQRLEAQNGGLGRSSGGSAQMPGLTLDIQRLSREVKFHENLFQILSRQYENARIDESYSPPVELVDRAVLPDEKAWPPRKQFALIGLVAGGLLGLLYILFQSFQLIGRLKRVLTDPAA
jgi:tyrosine-protein kinase Etk/Wzc